MTELLYIVQRPAGGAAILNAYQNLARAVRADRFTGLYAFASYKGARLLTDALRESAADWAKSDKRWVISIDGGVTEPEALRFLLRQRRTEVRVPDAETLINRKLRAVHRFHAKTLIVEAGTPLKPTGMIVGSANLTCSGLCFGHEHAFVANLTTKGRLSASISAGLDELAAVIDSATLIDESFVDGYAAIRPAAPAIPEEFEDARSEKILQAHAVLPAIEAASLAAAENLWVDVDYVVRNLGRNEEGSQIDLKRGTRVFVGFTDEALPRNSAIGTIRIRFDSHSVMRNLRFGNNQMDKLDLPIPGQEGPATYRNQTLLFTREADGSFRLIVGSAASISTWKERSRKLGTMFQMKSGREYGVF
jgi:HKD family nuclease